MPRIFVAFTAAFLANSSEAHRMRHRHSLRASTLFNFLHLEDALADCPKPVIIEGASHGIISFNTAEQACAEDPSCAYFMFNQKESKMFKCSDPRGFTRASPSSAWAIGVKPSSIERIPFKFEMNKQALCSNVVEERIVSSLDEAISLWTDSGAELFTLNLNQGGAGPSIASMSAFYCNGVTEGIQRNGFITVRHDPSRRPFPTKTFSAPCDVNGSIMADSSKIEEGLQPGEIVEARRVV